jgi:hypothetical protein
MNGRPATATGWSTGTAPGSGASLSHAREAGTSALRGRKTPMAGPGGIRLPGAGGPA